MVYYHTVRMTIEDNPNAEHPTDVMLILAWLSTSSIRDGEQVTESMGKVYHATPFIDRDGMNLE